MIITEVLNQPQIKIGLLRRITKTPPRTVVLATLNPDDPIGHIIQTCTKVADKYLDGDVAAVRILDGDQNLVIFTVIPDHGFDVLHITISLYANQPEVRDAVVKSVQNLSRELQAA